MFAGAQKRLYLPPSSRILVPSSRSSIIGFGENSVVHCFAPLAWSGKWVYKMFLPDAAFYLPCAIVRPLLLSPEVRNYNASNVIDFTQVWATLSVKSKIFISRSHSCL